MVCQHGCAEGSSLEKHDAANFFFLYQPVKKPVSGIIIAVIMAVGFCDEHLSNLLCKGQTLQRLFNSGVGNVENLLGSPCFTPWFCWSGPD